MPTDTAPTNEAPPHKSLLAGIRESLDRAESLITEGQAMSAALELHHMVELGLEAARRIGNNALRNLWGYGEAKEGV